MLKKITIKSIAVGAVLFAGLITANSSHAFFNFFSKSSKYIDAESYKYFKEIFGPDIDKIFVKEAIQKLNGSKLFAGTGDKEVENFIFNRSIYNISDIQGAIKQFGHLTISNMANHCSMNQNYATPADILSNDEIIYFVSTVRYYVCSQFISWNNIKTFN